MSATTRAVRVLPFAGVHLFSLTLFLSAALAFVVQPLIAKRLLPLLGGSPAVWNTCLVFFQGTLLLGYALSDRLVRLRPRPQVVAHATLLLLAGAFAVYGWLAPLGDPAVGGSPTGWLLEALATTIGLPFLALSVNSTLLQRWFSLSGRREDPYSLYRASNLGSLLGLLAFPFFFEPYMTLVTQSRVWLVGFVALVALVVECARRVWTLNPPMASSDTVVKSAQRLSWRRRALWVAVAFVPSSLTIGVTTFISTDLAAVPLLWVIPLALYLASFALTFGPHPATSSIRASWWIYPVLVITVLVTQHYPPALPTFANLALHPLLLFTVGVIAHGCLAADRPPASRLTEFYLYVAVGGVLGGVFNTLIAPQAFSKVIEYPMVVAASAFILPMAQFRSRRSLVDVAFGLSVGAIALVGTAITQRMMPYGDGALAAIFALPTILCILFRTRWLRFGTAVGAVWLTTNLLPGAPGMVLHESRSFFGAMRVTAEEGGTMHVLRHGTTTHGRQDRRGRVMRKVPLSYYGAQGPIGQLMIKLRKQQRTLRVGVLGLGTGTMAAYAEQGDTWVFYEIDMAVVRVAQTWPWFSYLSESNVRPRIVSGDARVALSRVVSERFDLLVLDAFSSDAIPVHLVTREAFELYRRHLAPGGLVASHVSSRYIDLRPAIVSVAAAVGLNSVTQASPVTTAAAERGYSSSRWVVSGTSQALTDRGLPSGKWETASPTVRPWTDDYSNLAGAIVWRR